MVEISYEDLGFAAVGWDQRRVRKFLENKCGLDHTAFKGSRVEQYVVFYEDSMYGNIPVGLCEIDPDGRIHSIGVASEFQREGIGKKLVAYVAQQSSCEEITAKGMDEVSREFLRSIGMVNRRRNVFEASRSDLVELL